MSHRTSIARLSYKAPKKSILTPRVKNGTNVMEQGRVYRDPGSHYTKEIYVTSVLVFHSFDKSAAGDLGASSNANCSFRLLIKAMQQFCVTDLREQVERSICHFNARYDSVAD